MAARAIARNPTARRGLAAVITLIPVCFVYGILQRRMQEALVAGAAKG